MSRGTTSENRHLCANCRHSLRQANQKDWALEEVEELIESLQQADELAELAYDDAKLDDLRAKAYDALRDLEDYLRSV